MAYINKHHADIDDQPIQPMYLADLADALSDGRISQPMSKAIIKTIWSNPDMSVQDVIEHQGLSLISDDESLLGLINTVFEQSPQQLEQYRGGKHKLFGYFVGQIMKLSEGKAHPEKVNALLKNQLEVTQS